jgi:hypothetical protein
MGAFTMAIASAPQLPVTALYLPVGAGLLIASFLYMLVMPILSGFAALGILLFIIALAIGYRYYAPQETLMRLLVLVIFAALTDAKNDQVFVFAAVSNNLLSFTCILILLHISTLVPVRARPETRFLRLLERFQVSARQLQEPLPESWLARWRHAYHRHEVETIPGKLAIWLPRLSPALAEPVKEDIDALVQAVKDCQATLLQADAGDRATPIDHLDVSCAMIDWSAWHQPKF